LSIELANRRHIFTQADGVSSCFGLSVPSIVSLIELAAYLVEISERIKSFNRRPDRRYFRLVDFLRFGLTTRLALYSTDWSRVMPTLPSKKS
jgi:hypothetical protein